MLLKIKSKLYSWFSEPADVYSAIRPLFNMSSLVGLAPYALQLKNGRKWYKVGWLPLFRSALLILALLGSVAYNALVVRDPFRAADIQQKLHHCQEACSSLLSCWALLMACFFAGEICELFEKIDNVDAEFRKLAIWVPYKELYVNVVLHLAGLILAACLLIVNFAFVAPYSGANATGEIYGIFIAFMTVFLPYFINLLMELQYGHFLNVLRVRYRLLNEYLETLVREAGKTTVVEDVASPFRLPQAKKAAFTISNKLPKSMLEISDPVFIVDQAAALHIKLTDIAHMINYAFCGQQLLRITVAFISIVTALFLVAINFSKSSTPETQKNHSSQLNHFFTAWAFSNACEVVAIVWITSETCDEANNCPRILHKIRNNTLNVNLQDTIEIYSLQMYHNRLYFTVCGLFPLDYTLLYTIVAGVTTYLVILIQFNNADFVKKSTNTSEMAVNATIAPA